MVGWKSPVTTHYDAVSHHDELAVEVCMLLTQCVAVLLMLATIGAFGSFNNPQINAVAVVIFGESAGTGKHEGEAGGEGGTTWSKLPSASS